MRLNCCLSKKPASSKRGFTLVELLVVIGIIALLIGILLPALNKARRTAKTVKCGANLRSLMQAVNIYATENRGFLPGSPWTTGKFLFKPQGQDLVPDKAKWSDTNVPYVLQPMDWMAPIAKYIRLSFDDAGNAVSRKSRFTVFANHPLFTCPENTYEMTAFSAPDWGRAPMFSYCAASGFLVQRSRDPALMINGYINYCPLYAKVPTGYSPQLSKVGKSSSKIFFGDGGKFSAAYTDPDYDSAVFGSNGGMFADIGPASAYSRSWDRGAAPGNTPQQTSGTGPKRDARIYAYRHGTLKPYNRPDEFKANFVFFDGHVQLMGDLESADARYWYPRGTEIIVSDELAGHQDTIKRYWNGTPPASTTLTD